MQMKAIRLTGSCGGGAQTKQHPFQRALEGAVGAGDWQRLGYPASRWLIGGICDDPLAYKLPLLKEIPLKPTNG